MPAKKNSVEKCSSVFPAFLLEDASDVPLTSLYGYEQMKQMKHTCDKT